MSCWMVGEELKLDGEMRTRLSKTIVCAHGCQIANHPYSYTSSVGLQRAVLG